MPRSNRALPKTLAALSMAVLSSLVAQRTAFANSGTQLPLSQYTAGSEQTSSTLITNPSFEQPGMTGNTADGWTATSNAMFVDHPDPAHLPNPPGVIGNFSAKANLSNINNNEMYSQNISFAPNTDYVLSAYIWNYGLSNPDNDPTNLFAGDLAVVQFRASDNFFNSHGIILEPQPLGGAMGDGANGYFVYKYFNSRQYPSNNVALEVLSDPNEDLPGARPTLMAQWDNIAITPINQFSAQRWNSTGGGNWGDNTKWVNNAPNYTDAIANFGSIITSTATITLEAPKAVSVITFDSANSYNIVGTSTLTLSHSETFEDTLINVLSGSHTIATPIALGRNLRVNVVQANSTMTLSGDISIGTTTIQTIKNGAGALAMKNVRMAAATVNAGTLAILANGTNGGASKVGTLTIAGGATPTAALDLNDNDIVISNTGAGTISSLISNARHAGAWDRPGITSTAARNNPTHNAMLGVLTGAEYTSVGGTGSFSGQSYAASDVLVKYTYYGDTDFNGRVNFDDYVRTDNGFNNHLSGWLNGDFDLNGAVNFDDYVLIDLAFNTQSGTLGRALSFIDGTDRSTGGMSDPALRRVEQHLDQFGDAYARGFLSAVPEPTAFALGMIAVTGVLARRRRR